MRRQERRTIQLANCLPLIGAIALLSTPAMAQRRVEADDTLGSERSIVSPTGEIRGGATRGRNLFHSFREFGIDPGQSAYFINSSNEIRNILGRVTEGGRSEIFGTLGIRNAPGITSQPNLFLINPNGFLFGRQASINVSGSFVVTTANSLQFGDRGFFSATNPELPSQLLTVDPSSFLFSQVPTANIANESTSGNLGLALFSGRSLLLVGGDIDINGGRIAALGGRIELAGLAEPGSIGLLTANNRFSLSVPNLQLSNITLSNRAVVGMFGAGDIVVNADRFTTTTNANIGVSALGAIDAGDLIINSNALIASSGGIISNQVFSGNSGDAGKIDITTNSLALTNGARIDTRTFGQGNAGSITIRAIDNLFLGEGTQINSSVQSVAGLANNRRAGNIMLNTGVLTAENNALITSSINTGGTGRGGNIDITARSMQLNTGSQIQAAFFSTDAVNSSDTPWNTGNIRIDVQDTLTVTGRSPTTGLSSGIFTTAGRGATGTAGTIDIQAGTLQLTNGGLIQTGTIGQSNAGNIQIRADDSVVLRDSLLRTTTSGQGNSGGITIRAGDRVLLDGEDTRILSSIIAVPGFTGNRQAGNITVNANRLDIVNDSSIQSNVEAGAIGQGGSIDIRVNRLSLSNGGQIQSALRGGDSTSNLVGGQGRTGNIRIDVRDIFTLSGLGSAGLPSAIFTSVGSGSTGTGGNLSIITGSLLLDQAARFIASSFGQGNAGDISIQARDNVAIANDSYIQANLASGGRGQGGNIRISANNLSLSNGGQIQVSTSGRGDAGRVEIRAGDRVLLDGQRTRILSSINAVPGFTGSRRAGDITIDANRLDFSNGAGIQSNVEADAVGQGGNIGIGVNRLSLLSGGQIQSILRGSNNSNSIGGQGRTGNIRVRVQDTFTLNSQGYIEFPSGIFTSVGRQAEGTGGDISITSGSLTLQEGAQLTASLYGRGSAGNISIQARDNVAIDRSLIQTNIEAGARGRGGSIDVSARSVALTGGGQIQSFSRDRENGFTGGRGRTGNIRIEAENAFTASGRNPDGFPSGVFTYVGSGAEGNGGNIDVRSASLSLVNGGRLSAGAFGIGNSGNVTVRTDGALSIREQGAQPNTRLFFPSGIYTNVGSEARGNGGNISIRAGSLSLTGEATSPNIADLLNSRAFITTNTSGIGNAGNISLEIDGSIALSQQGYITSSVESGGRGNAGNIDIRGRSLSVTDGAQIAAVVFRTNGTLPGGRGNGGNVRIRATDFINLVGTGSIGFSSGILALTERGAVGNAGDISLNTGDLRIRNGAVVAASTFNSGNGGNIAITANSLEASGGGQIATNTRSSGRAGTTTLNIDRIVLSGRDRNSQSRIDRIQRYLQTPGITDRQTDVIVNEGINSGIFANTAAGSTGDGGTIMVQSDILTLADGAQISAATSGTGRAGNIAVRSRDRISLDNSTLSTAINSGATVGNLLNQRGNITLQTQSLTLNNQAEITASTAGRGNAGNIELEAEQVALDNSTISTAVSPGAIGQGGSITLQANRLNLNNNAQISANTAGTGGAGNITVVDADSVSLDNSTISTSVDRGAIVNNPSPDQQGNLEIQTRTLSLTNRAEVTASTTGQGNAGNIRVRDANTVRLNDRAQISSAVNQGGRGQGGRVDILTGRLELNDRAQISSSTAGQGNTGQVNIRARDQIRLSDRSRIQNTVEPGAVGNSQRITLTTPRLSLNADSAISAATAGQGNAGTITVSEANEVTLTDSAISTAVGRRGRGQGGNVQISTERLTLRDNAQISSSTAGEGDTGQVSILATERVSLQDSAITSTVQQRATGNSRSITLQTPALSLENSQISAATNGNGSAGTITVQDAEVIYLDNSFISTDVKPDGVVPGNSSNSAEQNSLSNPSANRNSVNRNQGSSSRGDRGNINLEARSLTLTNRSGITANTAGAGNAGEITLRNAEQITLSNSRLSTGVNERSSGQGGNIRIRRSGSLSLNDNAQITASSDGAGRAGDIQVELTGNLRATDSDITTSAQQSAGGAITVVADQIQLRGDSDIRSDVDNGTGGGGDITISASAVIAFDDSDILAFADLTSGEGGNITLNTDAFFGENYQPAPAGTDQAALDRNGRVDVNASGRFAGVIRIPDLSFIQNSLAELQATNINAGILLTRSCIVRSQRGDRFLVTGSGGLPTRPGNSAAPFPTGTIRTVPDSEAESPDQSWQMGDPIVEPQGVFQLPNGQLVMSRECSSLSSDRSHN